MDPSADVAQRIDREADLLASAVRLVASGAAARTTVAGLGLSAAAIDLVRPLAGSLGVVIEPIFGPDEATTDVRVRRRNDARSRE